MGGIESRLMLEEFAPVRNESKEHKITPTDNIPPKNLDYYSGKRFFKTSRGMYPEYVRGWFFGYSIDPDYYKNIMYNELSDTND